MRSQNAQNAGGSFQRPIGTFLTLAVPVRVQAYHLIIGWSLLDILVQLHVGMDVQNAARFRLEGQASRGPGHGRAGDQAQVDPVGHVAGAFFPVVPWVNVISVRIDIVELQVATQGLDRGRIPLAGVDHGGFGVHQVGQGEVSDAGKEINHSLLSTIELGNAQLFSDVANAEHAPGNVPRVLDPIVHVSHPRVGNITSLFGIEHPDLGRSELVVGDSAKVG